MDNIKKYLNKYTYLFIGLIVLIITSIFIIIPNFQTEEFSQEVIEDIIEGVTTTSIQYNEQEIQSEESGNLSYEFRMTSESFNSYEATIHHHQ